MRTTEQKTNPKVRARVALPADIYAAARHIAADQGPTIEVGHVIAQAVEEYVARERQRKVSV